MEADIETVVTIKADSQLPDNARVLEDVVMDERKESNVDVERVIILNIAQGIFIQLKRVTIRFYRAAPK